MMPCILTRYQKPLVGKPDHGIIDLPLYLTISHVFLGLMQDLYEWFAAKKTNVSPPNKVQKPYQKLKHFCMREKEREGFFNGSSHKQPMDMYGR